MEVNTPHWSGDNHELGCYKCTESTTGGTTTIYELGAATVLTACAEYDSDDCTAEQHSCVHLDSGEPAQGETARTVTKACVSNDAVDKDSVCTALAGLSAEACKSDWELTTCTEDRCNASSAGSLTVSILALLIAAFMW